MPGFLFAAFSVVPSWLWKYLAIAGVAVALYVAGDVRGSRIAKAKCDRAAELARQYANEQDNKAQREMQADDDQITQELRKQKEGDDEEIRKLREELAKRPVGNCALDDNRARGLRY